MLEALVEELFESGDAALDTRVRDLELERRRIEAELAVTIGEIDRRRAYLDDGHRSVKAYLRATCNASDAEAARLARIAAASAAVPGLVDALHQGFIGAPQANELGVAYANRRVRERLVEFAPMLLDQAERLSFREFRACVQRFVMLADLDGAHDDRDQSMANRRARVINLNGGLHLDAAGGDPLVNTELEAIFQRFCDLEFDADIAARRAEFGDHAEEHPLPRTAAQRGYDAFVAIMRHALANHQAGRDPKITEPLVNILLDRHTWAGLLADAGLAPDTNLAGEAVDPFTGTAAPSDLLADLMREPDSTSTRRCETSTGQIVHPHDVLRAALAGHIRRVVLGAANVPINMGRKSRVFTGAAREAAKLLAIQCDHLGCGLPADMCQIDHSTEWHEGGPTDQHNAGVDCGAHNREKHRKRWRTKRDIHGRRFTVRSDGTIILPAGARAPTFPDDREASPAEPATPAGSTEPTEPTDEPVGHHDDGLGTQFAEDLAGGLAPAAERRLDTWVTQTVDDTERRCRTLRAAAVRTAARHGDCVDLDVITAA